MQRIVTCLNSSKSSTLVLLWSNAHACCWCGCEMSGCMNGVLSNLLSLLACLHAVPYQTQTQMKVMEKTTLDLLTVFSSNKLCLESLLFVLHHS